MILLKVRLISALTLEASCTYYTREVYKSFFCQIIRKQSLSVAQMAKEPPKKDFERKSYVLPAYGPRPSWSFLIHAK